MFTSILYQDVCMFLAGTFFVNAGILFYLYLARVSVPILGTGLTETPEVSGVRSIVHTVLFLTFFYFGFIRRWQSRSTEQSPTPDLHLPHESASLDPQSAGHPTSTGSRAADATAARPERRPASKRA